MNLTPIRCLLLGGAALLISGCGEDPLGPEMEAFETARTRWEANGPESYTYRYRLSCFCPPQLLETARVTVTEGVVTDVYLLDSDAPAPPDTYDLYLAIEGLFDRLATSLENPRRFHWAARRPRSTSWSGRHCRHRDPGSHVAHHSCR